MVVDTLTFALGGILLLLAIITPFLNILFRKDKHADLEESTASPPHFSIVMSVHDQATYLERNLPKILMQNYEGFEVIVVDESSTDETSDVLTRMKKQYSNLYTTFIPESSHYLSRKKLALTIGVKAAHNEWIIFTDADCYPESDEWLATIAKYCRSDVQVVCGYTGYTADTKDFWKFERLLMNCHLLKWPYRYEGNNLAFRKSIFMERNGFLKNLRYLRGEYDFLVNECDKAMKKGIITECCGRIRQEAPTLKMWKNKHLYYMETRKHLKKTTIPCLMFNLHTIILHATYWIELIVLIYSLATHSQLLIAISAFCFMLTVLLRILIAKRTAKSFGEQIAAWKIPFIELFVVWENFYFMLKHAFTDKYNYIRK